MSLYRNATFGEIEYRDFIKGRDIEIRQEILDRSSYMSFSSVLQDFNVLTHIFTSDFYRIPSTPKLLVEGDRLDNIAYERFGDSDFWWILAKYNRIIDAEDLSDFTSIEIPLETFVMNYLLSKSLEWS